MLKGWDILVRAFLEEFTAEEAGLFIVTRHYHSERDPRDDINQIAAELGRSADHIHLLYDVPQEQMAALYGSANALYDNQWLFFANL